MTWQFGGMFSYVSSTFLRLLEAKFQATDLSFLPPKCSEKINISITVSISI